MEGLHRAFGQVTVLFRKTEIIHNGQESHDHLRLGIFDHLFAFRLGAAPIVGVFRTQSLQVIGAFRELLLKGGLGGFRFGVGCHLIKRGSHFSKVGRVNACVQGVGVIVSGITVVGISSSGFGVLGCVLVGFLGVGAEIDQLGVGVNVGVILVTLHLGLVIGHFLSPSSSTTSASTTLSSPDLLPASAAVAPPAWEAASCS